MRWFWERRLEEQLTPENDEAERERMKAEARRRLEDQQKLWEPIRDNARRIHQIRRENALGAAMEQAFRSIRDQ